MQHKNEQTLKQIRENLLLWDTKHDAIASLSESQKEGFVELTSISLNRQLPINLPQNESSLITLPFSQPEHALLKKKYLLFDEQTINSTDDFYNWSTNIEKVLNDENDKSYRNYIENLTATRSECDSVIGEVDRCIELLTVLKTNYIQVATKSNALHEACENLIEEQTQLVDAAEKINNQLTYFNQYDRISSKINAPNFSVSSDSFVAILSQLDDCLDYIKKHPQYKESIAYESKFNSCLHRVLAVMKRYIFNILQSATDEITNNTQQIGSVSSDDAFVLFYGKFRTNAPRIKSLVEQIEDRANTNKDYANLLSECHQCYFRQRIALLSSSISNTVNELATKYFRDHCTMVRSGCAFMIRVCEDENNLYFQFFNQPTALINETLENLCMTLYDTLRPFIIHINHLETLAELCAILKTEMLDEHSHANATQLVAFDNVCSQMLQDVQERLLYRTYIFIKQEILNYKPAPGDLAYPSKLQMMRQISESINSKDPVKKKLVNSNISNSLETESASLDSRQSNNPNLDRSISNDSLSNDSTQFSDPSSDKFLSNSNLIGSNMPMSAADLHAMWYPTVRRTLVCLSKLYRCTDKTTFQSMSQETLAMCVQSLTKASASIEANQTYIDSRLFLIKHLLILREQISPFQIDSVVKEMSLDFSKIKNAAVELLKARSKIFTFNSNNAMLQFLLEGTPGVTETLVDSRKEVDGELKKACEHFINHVTTKLIGELSDFVNKATIVASMNTASLSAQPFAQADKVSLIVVQAYKNLKHMLPSIQDSLSLYLANRETEIILFKPIKAKIIQAYQSLHSLVMSNYSQEDIEIISAPTVEQITLLISNISASMSSTNVSQVLAGNNNNTSVINDK